MGAKQIKGQNIVGRKKSEEYDFYETPEWATRLALQHMISDGVLTLDEDILEPCAGAGAISNVLKEMGFSSIKESDIQTADYIVGQQGVDVFALPNAACDTIITNPPYKAMCKEDMLGCFLRVAKSKVILLLNIFFLSSRSRKEMLECSHLKHIYIHSDRVTMYPYGEPKPTNGGTKMFAWFLWDKEYNGAPTISWL